MTGLTMLWLPILVSAVIIFLFSSVVHTMLPWHKNDFPKLPDEEAFRKAVGPMAIPPGDYMVPRPASMDDMKSAAHKEKMAQGPIVIMTVRPNGVGMQQSLVTWFFYLLFVGVIAAYVAGRALPPGTDYLHVFRFAGVTAFACYGMSLPQASIWYGKKWSTTLVSMFDALLYGLLTAGTFGWLWPK